MGEGLYLADHVNEPIDIIVPTHGRLELTIQCLNALYAHTKVPFHLIIVDDSNDLTMRYIKGVQKQHDNITVVHSNISFKSGNQFFNIGLSKGNNKFVAMVMNSILVEPDWEVVAIQMMKESPKMAIVGLKTMFAEDVGGGKRGLIESAGIKMLGYTPVDIGRDLPGHRLAVSYQCEAVQWACCIVRREAVVGNLDEALYHGFKGWDDIDNCFVLRDKGWEVWYCGLACCYHFPRSTRGSNSQESHDLNKQNAEYFYKRWGYWNLYKELHPDAPELTDYKPRVFAVPAPVEAPKVDVAA